MNNNGFLKFFIILSFLFIGNSFSIKGIDPKKVSVVKVVCACHYDSGFASWSIAIMNEYFQTYYPQVRINKYKKHQENRKQKEEKKFKKKKNSNNKIKIQTNQNILGITSCKRSSKNGFRCSHDFHNTSFFGFRLFKLLNVKCAPKYAGYRNPSSMSK